MLVLVVLVVDGDGVSLCMDVGGEYIFVHASSGCVCKVRRRKRMRQDETGGKEGGAPHWQDNRSDGKEGLQLACEVCVCIGNV